MKGQIIKILSNLYFVKCDETVYKCYPRGRFRNENITPLVGDYVEIDAVNNYILKVLPRKNSLVRPMVSNVDQAIIVTSLKAPDLSTNLLDKLLLVLSYNKIKPVICISKYDLLKDEEIGNIIDILKYYEKIGYEIVYNTNLDDVKKIFKDKVSVLTGQTGAGKSTLLNRLDESLNLATGEISKALGRGKHTTRHVELIELFGGRVVDTPGFSLISLESMKDENIKDGFVEFNNYPCPFKDCMHINEGECEVKKAVNDGEIMTSRYENYKKFIEKR